MNYEEKQKQMIKNIWMIKDWWHGTDHVSGINIMRNGPQINRGNIGTAFYISDDYQVGNSYSKSKSSNYTQCNPQPFKAVIQVRVKPGFQGRIIIDTYKEHAKRMSTNKHPNAIQHWALSQGYVGYGHFMDGIHDTKIKLAIYDPDALEIISMHVLNEI
jgi:hypothetical protein